MTSAKPNSPGAKKVAKPTGKKGAAARATKAAPAFKLTRSTARRYVAFDTPIEPKHTTRQRIAEAVADAA